MGTLLIMSMLGIRITRIPLLGIINKLISKVPSSQYLLNDTGWWQPRFPYSSNNHVPMYLYGIKGL